MGGADTPDEATRPDEIIVSWGNAGVARFGRVMGIGAFALLALIALAGALGFALAANWVGVAMFVGVAAFMTLFTGIIHVATKS